MTDVNLDTAVRDLIASEIGHALEPYQDVLSRLSQFLGSSFLEPSADSFSPARVPARRGRRRSAPVNGKDDVSVFKLGQTVSYRQGRGTFEALVTKIDAPTGTLLLQRISDGKAIARPASKVLA